MNDPTSAPKTSIQSMTRTFAILEHFAYSHEPLSVLDISRKLDLNRTTVHGLIKTMLQCGYIQHSTLSGQYVLSPKLYSMVCDYPYRLEVVRNCGVLLNALSAATNVNVHLGILNGDYNVLMVKCFTPPDGDASTIGQNFPLHASAMGKMMLANQPQSVREQILSVLELYPFTEKTLTDAASLEKELELVRTRGYSHSFGEYIAGIDCIAFPIWDSRGNICAAFSLSGIPREIAGNQEKLNCLLVMGRQYTMRCSTAMGWNTVRMGALPTGIK